MGRPSLPGESATAARESIQVLQATIDTYAQRLDEAYRDRHLIELEILDLEQKIAEAEELVANLERAQLS